MNVFPQPVNTPFADPMNKNQFSYPWSQYFKSIGDNQVQANIMKNLSGNSNFKYCLNGLMCVCNFYVTSPTSTITEITLPYTSLCAFECLGTVYPPATIKITIPVGTTFTQFFYMVKLQ
jgi:hypothetical protein